MQKGKPAKKYSQAGRLHSIIRLLETRRGMTLDDLASECDVDRRTIHRDLNAVAEAGYSLSSEWQDGKKIYGFMTKSRNIPPVNFTLNQLMTLYLLRSLGNYLAGTPFQPDIEDLFLSINSVLPDRYVAHLERIARVSLPLLHGARDYSSAAPCVENLQKALLHQYRIRMEYAKKDVVKKEVYDLDPYTLIFHKGGIYLLAYAHNRKATRLFALERIRAVELTKQRFEIPQGYDPEKYFHQAFGLVNDQLMPVKIRFAGEIAHAVQERTWMPGQRLTKDDQGRILLEFDAAGEMELVAWILSYGANAEVLEPPELRRKVKLQIREMRDFYRSKVKKERKS